MRAVEQPRPLAWALFCLGEMAYQMGRYTEAIQTAQECIAIGEESADQAVWMVGCWILARSCYAVGEYEKARSLHQGYLELAQSTSIPRMMINARFHLGEIACATGDYEQAEQQLAEALSLNRTHQDFYGIGSALNLVGRLAYQQRQYERARRLYLEAYRNEDYLGVGLSQSAETLCNLGYTCCALKRYQEAQHYLRQSLELILSLHYYRMAPRALLGADLLLRRLGNAERALELLSLVRTHSASMWETKQQAEAAWNELAPSLPPSTVATIEQRAKEQTLQVVCEEVLAELKSREQIR